jgi:hypothetical protein
MKEGRSRRLVRGAGRLYRAALLAYPAEFRRRWARQMVETFRDGSREAARGGPGALARFWLRAGGDLIGNAVMERCSNWRRSGAMSRSALVVGVLTLAGAVAFCWLCLHTDETGILACSVMILGGLLGLARPRQAWLAALLLGLGAPAAQLLGHLFGWPVPYPNGPVPGPGNWHDVAGACVALIFSTVGAVGGALFGWLIRQATERDGGLSA